MLDLAPDIGIGSGRRFSPASLFAASEPGGWWDPSDLTTLFQDTAGTVPVTAAGQSVARVNDKSGRGNNLTQSTAGNRPTYQVDGTGRGHLLFDGTDDFLVTPTITPGTDKAQVFAGVRKLSDAAFGMIAEHSTGAGAGRVYLGCSNGGGNYVAQYAGTGSNVNAQSGPSFPAPITNVATALANIAAPDLTLRLNGTVAANNTTTPGTGNFGAFAFYVGRRNGTSLPFNGRIYGLILRFGANLSAAQIASTEAWLNQRTGAY